jgi:hypothetical protein
MQNISEQNLHQDDDEGQYGEDASYLTEYSIHSLVSRQQQFFQGGNLLS